MNNEPNTSGLSPQPSSLTLTVYRPNMRHELGFFATWRVMALNVWKAREALDDARVLRARQSLRGAANRTYYAMFHAVSALALERQVSYKTHSGLIAFFQRDFVKAGVFDRSHGRALQKAFEDRSDADYDDVINISDEQIDRRLDEATRFVDA